jgi:hypothetical protein
VAAFDGFAQPGAPTWALALAARCHALLSDDGTAGFEEALRLHARGDRPFDHARTELLFGECLGAQGRRAESRDQLRAALATFEQLGATGWADRARAALRASGEAAERVDSSRLSRLTSQEHPRLARDRLSARGSRARV